MAEAIEKETGQPVELISGDRGEFSVWVDDDQVAKKDFDGFPRQSQAVDFVVKRLMKDTA